MILHALDKVSTGELSDAKKQAVRGFVHTIQALDLLEVIVTHDTNGAVIDTDQPIVEPPATQPLGAIVDKAAVYAEIIRLLDDGVKELGAGTEGFPFVFSSGYHNDDAKLTFDTPPTFQTFNRAIRARVAAYVKDYPGVLLALSGPTPPMSPAPPMSFLDDSATADFTRGVYYVYSTKTGDAVNGLINPNIYGHPSLQTDAMTTGTMDARFSRKVRIVGDDEAGSVTGTPLMSNLRFACWSRSRARRAGRAQAAVPRGGRPVRRPHGGEQRRDHGQRAGDHRAAARPGTPGSAPRSRAAPGSSASRAA